MPERAVLHPPSTRSMRQSWASNSDHISTDQRHIPDLEGILAILSLMIEIRAALHYCACFKLAASELDSGAIAHNGSGCRSGSRRRLRKRRGKQNYKVKIKVFEIRATSNSVAL
jgi:hypothetical protein